MLPVVAAKSLWRDKGRSIAAVVVVMLIAMLIALPSAIKKSAIENPLHYIERSGTDVFVLDAGLDDYISTSIVSQQDLDRVRRLPAVDKAQGASLIFARVASRAKSQSAVVQSFDPGAGFGGPWKLSAGRTVMANGEAVVDRALADLLGIELGGRVEVGGVSYTAVGLSEETASIGKQLVFITSADAETSLTQPGVFMHILAQSSQPELAVHQITELGLSAFTRQEFYQLNKDYWTQQIAPTLDLVVVATTVLGLILLVVMFHRSIRERVRELALRRAQGVGRSLLWGQELLMVAVLAAVGLSMGILAAVGATGIANGLSPGLESAVDQATIQFTVALVLVASVLAVIPSLVSLERTDPALILKEVTA